MFSVCCREFEITSEGNLREVGSGRHDLMEIEQLTVLGGIPPPNTRMMVIGYLAPLPYLNFKRLRSGAIIGR